MDSLNLDHLAQILELLSSAAHGSPVQWVAIASTVLGVAAYALRRFRASKVPVAAVEAKAVEVVKEVDLKVERKLDLDSLLPK